MDLIDLPHNCIFNKVITGCGGTTISLKNAENYVADNIRILHAENMEQAVQLARENAVKGGIVSLSPASTSFDKYKNFERRGQHFKALVAALN